MGTAELAELGDVPDRRLTVVVPDVPGAFRTMTNDGPVALLRKLGPTRLARAALGIKVPSLATPTGRIWQGFAALARTEAGAVPAGFAGRVLLDGYLVDLASATGRLDELVQLVDDLRRRFPQARIGIETNAPELARVALPLLRDDLDVVLALGRPGGGSADAIRTAAGRRDLTVLVKTGPQPPEVVAAAAADPSVWVTGDDALVADWRGVAPFAVRYVEVLARAMRTTGCPEWALDDALSVLALTERTPVR